MDRVARQPVIGVVDRVPIGPAAGEAVPLHRGAQISDIVVAVHHDAADARIVRVGPVILHVPGLVAELFEADQIIDSLPGDAGQRHLPDEMQEDDFAACPHDISGSIR